MTKSTISSQPPAVVNNDGGVAPLAKKDYQSPQGYGVHTRVIRDKISHYPADAQDALIRLRRIMSAEGWTQGRAAQQIEHKGKPISPSALSLLFCGRYETQLGRPLQHAEPIITSIRNFNRSHAREKLALGDVGFVETRVAKAISQHCSRAVELHKPAFLWGRTQWGKTRALQAFAATWQEGHAIYYEVPAGSSYLGALKALCRLVGVAGKSVEACRAEIFGTIDCNYLLIVDELHRAFTTYPKGQALKFWEVLRELFDRNRCALVLCGTTRLAQEMHQGDYAELLDQLAQRTRLHMDLGTLADPDRPEHLPNLRIGDNKGTRSDVARIAHAFGLECDPEIDFAQGGPKNPRGTLYGTFADIRDVMASESLGAVFDLFVYARTQFADKARRALTWADFGDAYDRLKSLS